MGEELVVDTRERLSELIDQALAGADVVVAKRTIPVVKLVPMEPVERVGNGPSIAAAAVRLAGRYSARRTSAEIDADIRAERDSWT